MSYKTEQREKLFELLKAHPHESFTVKDIANALKEYEISISAIYRNLATLNEDGIVRRSIKENSREAVYQYINDNACKGEIHLICLKCGKTTHLNHFVAKSIQDSLMKSEDFALDKKETVIYGLCKQCRNK